MFIPPETAEGPETTSGLFLCAGALVQFQEAASKDPTLEPARAWIAKLSSEAASPAGPQLAGPALAAPRQPNNSAGAGALGSAALLSLTPLPPAQIVGTDILFGFVVSLIGSGAHDCLDSMLIVVRRKEGCQ